MEVDGVTEAFAVAVTAGHALQPLHLGVEASCKRVGDAVMNGVEDLPQVVIDHAGDAAHRCQAATHAPAEPAQPGAPCPTAASVVPQSDGDFLHRSRPRHLQGAGAKRLARVPALGVETSRVAELQVAGAGEAPVAAGAERAVLGAAHLVESRTEVLGDVEPVEADFLFSPRNLRHHRGDARLVHVHRDGAHGGPRHGIVRAQESFQCITGALIGHTRHLAADHLDICVATLKGGFVERKPQASHHRAEPRLTQPVDDQRPPLRTTPRLAGLSLDDHLDRLRIEVELHFGDRLRTLDAEDPCVQGGVAHCLRLAQWGGFSMASSTPSIHTYPGNAK